MEFFIHEGKPYIKEKVTGDAAFECYGCICEQDIATCTQFPDCDPALLNEDYGYIFREPTKEEKQLLENTTHYCVMCGSEHINSEANGRKAGACLDLCNACYWRIHADSAFEAEYHEKCIQETLAEETDELETYAQAIMEILSKHDLVNNVIVVVATK